MKNLKYILFTGIASLFLTSCGNDFLDVTPQGQLTADQYFSEEERIDDGVSQIYSCLNWRFFRLGNMYFSTHEMGAGDLVAGASADLRAFEDFSYMANNWFLELYWGRWYQYLNDCNVVIDLAKDKTSDIAIKATAQARFFRAYHYFDMIQVFGEVPLRDHVPGLDEIDIPKSSEEEIYTLIISDLEYAIANLPTHSQWGEANNGRICKETAEGWLSIVYLFRQDYANALKYAENVINSGTFSLYSNYRDLFAPWNNYSTENMMPGHYSYQNIAGRVRNPYAEYQGLPTEEGYGSYLVLPSPEMVKAYEDGDLRKTASIFTKGDQIEGLAEAGKTITWLSDYEAKGLIYGNRKVLWDYDKNGWNYPGWPNGDFFSQELNLPFLRYAEILLIAAEASNEQGNTAKAQELLEQIRFRARGNKTFEETGKLPKITTTDKTELRHAIWNERRIEFAFEGRRWFDLIRYEKVEAGYMTNFIRNILGRGNFDYNKHTKFPVPQINIDSSDGILVQNDYWK